MNWIPSILVYNMETDYFSSQNTFSSNRYMAHVNFLNWDIFKLETFFNVNILF